MGTIFSTSVSGHVLLHNKESWWSTVMQTVLKNIEKWFNPRYNDSNQTSFHDHEYHDSSDNFTLFWRERTCTSNEVGDLCQS